MNRMEEYNALLQELETPPETLEYTVDKALNRNNALQKKWRTFRNSAAGVAACFAGFVVLVNAFPTFAKACGNIPLLRELAEAVSFSPSLTAAVEHEYVQPIGQTQTVDGVTASVEHVIVDRKQVSVFFTLDSDLSEHLDFEYDITLPEERMGWSSSTGSFGEENGQLRRIDANFLEINVPDTLYLDLRVYDSTEDWEPDPEAPSTSIYADHTEPERNYLADFRFTLEFDPYFTAQGEVLAVNTDFLIDGQTMTLTEVEVYPTHLRVNLEDDPDNTAWLKGLDLYLENEHGEQYHSGVNGISAAGDLDGEGYATFWLDSPFFGQGEHLTLHITGARWLQKEGNRVLIDPERGTAENLPAGVLFLGGHRENGVWWVSFAARREPDGGMYQLFSHQVWTEDGTALEDVMQWGQTMGYRPAGADRDEAEDTMFTSQFPLEGYTGGKLWLEPVFTHTTDLTEAPISIPIK